MNSFFKVVTVLTALCLTPLCLTHTARAADLSVYTKAPLRTAPAYDWSGFYVGATGGGGYGNHNLVNALGLAGNANYTVNYSSDGALAGGEAGYNVQSGNFVVGVEGDYFWSNIKGDDAFALGSNDATRLRSVGTIRARGGIAIDRWLLFFTGGWAYGDFQHTNTDPIFGIDRFTSNRSGLTASGGIAYALTDDVIGKFEYRYYDFGAYSRDGAVNFQLPYTVNNTYSVVTVGLDFKFGGPIVARY